MDPYFPPPGWTDEMRLEQLASQFRNARSDEERRRISVDYAYIVLELIESGTWDYCPSFEAQLPDEWMPKAFYEYWLS